MGPLQGVRILEIAGIGPTQLAGMLLAEMGADVIRIVRPASPEGAGEPLIPVRFDLMNRSRPAVAVDLKSEAGVDLVLRLCERADALFEGFRPGVMERLGLGPDQCMARNRRLVYGRMTGWGQDGPLAESAGHDTNYIALAGALGAMGEAGRPPPMPLNLVGDFGGGALYLALGLLAALLESTRSGEGQVVDAAMVDGVASMMTMFFGLRAAGTWTDRRESNLLDGAAPFARTYATSDGGYLAVCAIENRFFRSLLSRLGVTGIDPAEQYRTERWPAHREILEAKFRTRSRDDWERVFAGSNACVAPVLSIGEAPRHEHNRARQTYVTVDGIEQPAPAPRFSRTASEVRHGPIADQDAVRHALARWGLDDDEVEALVANTYASPGMG
jgi:alpha-methylacyl-CoA racemase